nr:hypothetical protein [Rubrobacter marinus]
MRRDGAGHGRPAARERERLRQGARDRHAPRTRPGGRGRGRVRAVDAGEVNGIPFNNGLGIGFDAEVAEGVAEAPKALGGSGGTSGRSAACCGHEVPPREHKARGRWRRRDEDHPRGGGPGHHLRGPLQARPGASLSDGAFDVVWSEEVDRAEVLRLVPAVLRGTHLSHPKVHFARAREVEVTLAEPVPAHVDGEMLPPTREFRARVLPGALRVLVP